MAWIQSYGCVSAAGDSADELWKALSAGRPCHTPWLGELRAFQFQGPRPDTVRELLVDKLRMSFQGVKPGLQGRYGVIFASTKGLLQDFVGQSGHALSARDPLTPLLEEFVRREELRPERSVCVSNACSSGLAAMALSERWMAQGLDQVLIIAADAVSAFVIKGFQALKLISKEGPRPFSFDRDGFFLGEAAACLLLSREQGSAQVKLAAVGLDSEGSAVTRPSSSGESLRQAARRLGGGVPDLMVCHGTGTIINDETEDLAFHNFFDQQPWVTGTKWCVGHTLAASGLLDTIAGCEALARQQAFRLATTHTIDPKFKGRYLTASTELPRTLSRVMISSLGFGGMHASILLEPA